MPTLDIFNNDAFSLSALSQTITDLPRVPTQIGDEGLFTEYGINSLTMMIERQGSALNLVPAAPRGGVPEPVKHTGRKLIPVAGIHLPQSGSILADQVQGIRTFGSETELESVQSLVNRELAVMKANLDLTLEYHRIGALKGQVLDADGTTVLLDLYDVFGMTQQTVFFDLSNPNSDVKGKTIALKRLIKQKLGGRAVSGVKVKASQAFFDAYTQHPKMLQAWDRWQDGQYLRMDQSEGDFEFVGVVWQIYDGGTSAGDFVPEGLGYAYPTGVPRMFQTAYCPADFMETVNTNGLPYYAKQDRMKWDKGIEFYSQSNPIHLNTLPEAVIEVSAAAS